MRLGQNPNKDKVTVKPMSTHRIISAIYVPNFEGYYQNYREVLSLFFDSLFKTKFQKTKITLIDNGSCQEVQLLLTRHQSNGFVNKLVRYSKNIGKVDALMNEIKCSEEQYVTITDCDILFQPSWEKEVFDIFKNFSEVGSVSPIPLRGSSFYYTTSVFMKILTNKFSLKKIEIPENTLNHNRFLNSLGWPSESESKLIWHIIEKNNCKAVIGGSHAVTTINTKVLLKYAPRVSSFSLLGNNSETNYFDIPIDLSGLMRLSTFNVKAFHIGNTPEHWMYDIVPPNIIADEHSYYPNIEEKNPIIDNLKIAYRYGRYYLLKRIVRFLVKLRFR